MTYQANRGRLALNAAGALLFVAIGILIPGLSGFVRVAEILFFGVGVLGFAIPAAATTRITVTDDTVTLRRFRKACTFAADQADVHWQRMPVGFTKLGWTVTVLHRNRARPGMRLPLFAFDPGTIQAVRDHLARVTGAPKNSPLVRRRRTA